VIIEKSTQVFSNRYWIRRLEQPGSNGNCTWFIGPI